MKLENSKVKVGDVILYHNSNVDKDVPAIVLAIIDNQFTLKRLFRREPFKVLGMFDAEVIGHIDDISSFVATD